MTFDDKQAIFEFHISGKCRDKYKIDETLFSIRGSLIIADFRRARYLAQKINEVRVSEGRTEELVTAGHINGLGLLHEILHFIIRYYEEKENPGAIQRALYFISSNIPAEDLDSVLLDFIRKFPPLSVYKNEISPEDYLNGRTADKNNREIILEEIYLLHIENINPAVKELNEFFSDQQLAFQNSYKKVLELSELFFRNEKTLGSDNLNLFEFLRKPVITSPFSLEEQLNFIRENWSFYIFEVFNIRLLGGRDLIQEDMRLFYRPVNFDKPTPPVPVYEFDKNYFDALRARILAGEQLNADESRFYYSEYEKFTHDVEWMPKVVMIAKNVFVWMNQLSQKYSREIRTLDNIPDEELNQLAEWNFTALWLIGIWERSSASRKIKQIMGNPEAAASAYSLYDYVIAAELGGEDAFQNLKYRAALRGIRLASDMVPNHTGIYSKWVVEKPDYFLQNSNPPYPSYNFNGPDLSDDNRVQVRIEDKYYNHSDAAVVFQRRDNHTGDVRYIYHGNDGTHMPWNDTAQLNLLNPEVREALIQTIMHVARKTPIIRFDAAMTLAKKHYQRLWFPQPGTGGAIPSRSDFSITRDQFDQALPEEFWREVVDRMNSEMPETLLLAEAFWLMEGYFVRTLGMHRVYNSAFMHMMMKEENEKYRLLIKNTLEFNAEILKRYVNFMSNPDEETALNQFGKGDKYFGVCMLMVTLPGLPMFAHGQIEGFAEKYGMEYKRSYYNEYPDGYLIDRHRHEIFPLLKKRYLFSQVYDFQFYDYIDNSGNINENVFAFSNRSEDETAFIVYNNSYTETKGTIHHSFSKPYPGSGYRSIKITDALNLKTEYNIFYKVHEHRTGLKYLLSGKDIMESGIFIPLNGYEYRIYMNFEQVFDTDGNYQKLFRYLDGRGVYSLEETLSELTFAPFHYSFAEVLNENSFTGIKEFINRKSIKIPENINRVIKNTLDDLVNTGRVHFDTQIVLSEIIKDISNLKKVSQQSKTENTGKKKIPDTKKVKSQKKTEVPGSISLDKLLPVLIPHIILYRIFTTVDKGAEEGYKLFDDLLINRVVFSGLCRYMSPEKAGKKVHLIKIMSSSGSNELKEMFAGSSSRSSKSVKLSLNRMMEDKEIENFLGVNEYDKIKYFSKEYFEEFLQWIFVLNTIFKHEDTNSARMSELYSKLIKTAENGGYRLDDLLKAFDAKEKRSYGRKKTLPRSKKKNK